jgi:outer membrane protein assembly factor BamA
MLKNRYWFIFLGFLLSGITVLPTRLTAQRLVFSFNTTSDSLIFYKEISPGLLPQKPKTGADMAFQNTETLRAILNQLREKSYLEASLDALEKTDSVWVGRWHVGRAYRWAALQNGNIPSGILSRLGLRSGDLDNFSGKKIDAKAVLKLQNLILNYAEDNGFPFAQVWLDALEIPTDSTFSAALMLTKGQVFRFDSLIVEGEAGVSERFLRAYLGLRKGEFFSRSKILKLSQRLAELPFLSEKQKPVVRFQKGFLDDGKVWIRLFLEKKKSSRWDFLVGIQPNTNNNGPRFGITFNGKADFQSALGLGERIYANLENLRPQSPRANVKVSFPYFLGLPFGFDGAFDLYKRDSTYLETHLNGGVQYLLGGTDYVKVFWNNYTSNNLLLDTKTLLATRRLPPTLDVSTNTFGLEFSKNTLDYRFNPRKGGLGVLRGSVGTRTVRKNTDLVSLTDPSAPDFLFSNLYDTVSLKNIQYQTELRAEFYWPILKRSTLKTGLNAAWLSTKTPLSQNEQYRLGGNRLLRGFDEESIFATRYAVLTIEYRLLLGRNSNLYVFGDGGWVTRKTRFDAGTDKPWGMGAGISFETAVGLFGVSLAVGKQQNNPLDFRNIKTHIGYVSLF